MTFTPPFLLLINFQHFDFEDILVVSGVVRINMSSLPNRKIRMVRMVLSQIPHKSKLTKKLQISAMLSSGQSFKFQQDFLFIRDFMPNNCTSNKALFVQDQKPLIPHLHLHFGPWCPQRSSLTSSSRFFV